MTTQKSPYLKHAELVLGNYSAGETLREFVINLYSGRRSDLSRVRSLDTRHRAAFLEILHYYLAAESDDEMTELVEMIHTRYRGRYC